VETLASEDASAGYSSRGSDSSPVECRDPINRSRHLRNARYAEPENQPLMIVRCRRGFATLSSTGFAILPDFEAKQRRGPRAEPRMTNTETRLNRGESLFRLAIRFGNRISSASKTRADEPD